MAYVKYRSYKLSLTRYQIPLRRRLWREHEGYDVRHVELIGSDVLTPSNEVLTEYRTNLIGFVRARSSNRASAIDREVILSQRTRGTSHRRYDRDRTYVLCL